MLPKIYLSNERFEQTNCVGQTLITKRKHSALNIHTLFENIIDPGSWASGLWNAAKASPGA